MKKIILFVAFMATIYESNAQWAVGGGLNNRFGNSASGPAATQWRSWGFGNFTAFGAVP